VATTISGKGVITDADGNGQSLLPVQL